MGHFRWGYLVERLGSRADLAWIKTHEFLMRPSTFPRDSQCATAMASDGIQ